MDDLLTASLTVATTIFAAVLAYYFGMRKARYFSLVKFLYKEKYAGYKSYFENILRIQQLIQLIQQLTSVKCDMDATPIEKYQEILISADLIDKLHGIRSTSIPETLYRDDDSFTKEIQNLRLDQIIFMKAVWTCDELIHAIQHELTGLIQNNHLRASGLKLVTAEDELMDSIFSLDEGLAFLAFLSLAPYSSDMQKVIDECNLLNNAIFSGLRTELDRTRTARLSKKKRINWTTVTLFIPFLTPIYLKMMAC